MKDIAAPKTLVDAIRYYSDLDRCQDLLVSLRWPDGVTCPTCGSTEVGYLATRRVWKCRTQHERQQFSIKIGTIFEDSPIGLDKWFAAMWLVCNCKNGVSSYEIARGLGVTQKTGWFMLHRLRLAMQTGTFEKMGGEVEADETYVGGKARFMHAGKRREKQLRGRSLAGKAVVMGLLERHGKDGHSRVKASVVQNVKKHTLHHAIRTNVESGAEMYTDAYNAYVGLDPDYTHKVIDHAERYVDGKIHTNGMENFWSLLKRAIKGTYVSVEPFHLFRYVDEQSFRFNNRKATDRSRFIEALGSIFGRRVTYKQLIGIAPATT